MKQVKVYTLKEDDLLITNDFISFYSDKNLLPVLATSPTEFYDSSVSITQSPIKRVIIDGNDYYYSFDPKLEKAMKAYYGVYDLESDKILAEEKLTVKNIEVIDLIREKCDLRLELLDTYYNLENYQSMSIWKRIVFLFTGRLKCTKQR